MADTTYKKVTEDGIDYIEVTETQTVKRLISTSELEAKKAEYEQMLLLSKSVLPK